MSDSGLASALFAVAGGMPLVLAEAVVAQPTPPQMNGVVIPIWALSLAVTMTLGVIGYLLKRSLDQVDRSLEKLDARVGEMAQRVAPLDSRVTALEKKLDKE